MLKRDGSKLQIHHSVVESQKFSSLVQLEREVNMETSSFSECIQGYKICPSVIHVVGIWWIFSTCPLFWGCICNSIKWKPRNWDERTQGWSPPLVCSRHQHCQIQKPAEEIGALSDGKQDQLLPQTVAWRHLTCESQKKRIQTIDEILEVLTSFHLSIDKENSWYLD